MAAQNSGGSTAICETGGFVVYRTARGGGRHELLKAPASAPPPATAIEQLEHELEVARDLNPEFVVRPVRLERRHDGTVLVMDDFACETLAARLRDPLDLGAFFEIAIGAASALAEIHRNGIVHRDVKPDHVFVGVGSADRRVHVKLTGLGMASKLSRERTAPGPLEAISGTFAYMAPEQTGRMNRSVDSRSDLYSLGVAFYEMLTGTLPFAASDPAQWVHCHIAIQPVSPSERVAAIPEQLSAIVMKLLAKTAESRYQTAEGLKTDLARCAAEWHASGRISRFTLGAHDIPDRWLVPEKLYGREREIDALLAAYGRVVRTGAPELILVSGYSGVGKSALVNELHRVLGASRGLFAEGKLDQYRRNIPYGILGQAFEALVDPLLSKSEAEFDYWRGALQKALAPNGRLVTDIAPKLKLVIGEQPDVPELDPRLAKARFHLVFRHFIEVFATAAHPLAVFIDDLQWLDAASLDVIEDLLTQEDVRHLLLIGAYRDNEVDASHPLLRKLGAIRSAGGQVHEIALAPLTLDEVTSLTADALHCDPGRATPLAGLVHAKTAGNPFFVLQFLSALHQEGLIAFDHGAGRWRWDLQGIRAKGYTDNVADLMAGKLTRLPPATQRALEHLACLGSSATAQTLSLVLDETVEQVHADLEEAVRHELVGWARDSCTFGHDRVQEAAYALIPATVRAELHLRIGRLLEAQTPQGQRETAIFEIVDQLNRGAALMTEQQERDWLAELNLVAGRRAKASTAYALALSHLEAGATLLGEGGWERRRELRFALELNRAECEYLTSDLAAAGERLEMLASSTTNVTELAAVTVLRINLDMVLDKSDSSVAVGRQYLARVGIGWSPQPTRAEVEQEFERMWRLLGDRPIERIIDLPLMTDVDSRATLDVLTTLLPPALFVDPNLHRILIARIASFSLEHGNTDGSCFAYVWLGMLLGPQFGDYEAGFRFGQLSVDLVDKHGLLGFKARVYMGFGHVLPWTRHIRTGVPMLRAAFEAAQEAGDLSFATLSRGALITHLLACGSPLAQVQREAEAALDFAQKARFGQVADMIMGQLGLIRTLRGLTPQFGSFSDAEFDERRLEELFLADPRLAYSGWRYWIRKLQARNYAGDPASALVAASQADRLCSPSFLAYFEIAEYHFHAALARAAYAETVAPEDRASHRDALVAHHRQLALWAEHGAETFEDRAALVGAEIARLEGRPLDAERLYEQAIESARANGFIHNEALANELAGRFYLDRGLQRNGLAHLRDARACYAHWGADGKVRQLDQAYPQLTARADQVAATPATAASQQLDVAAMLKASQALSGEIELHKLVETLMTIALGTAGADRAFLILPGDAGFEVEAQAHVAGTGIEFELVRAAISQTECLEAVVNYVIRTRQSVILDDTSRPAAFLDDAPLRVGPARSLCCLPLLRQGELAGVLYLENTRATFAFTADRIAVLDVLAAQAAISLENARLYSDLRESTSRYRRLNRELRAITRCNEVLMRASDEQALLDDICRIVCDEAGYRMAWVGYAEHDPGQIVRPVAWAGVEDGYLAQAGIVWADTERGQGPAGTAIRTGRVVYVQDFATDPRAAPWRDAAAARGYRATIGLPLRDERANPFGVLVIYASGPDAFTPEESRLLEELAGDLAFGIGVLRARDAQTSLEEQLRQAQKMEVVGQLAGGIAHDFNNLLTAIGGYGELLRAELQADDHASRADLDEMLAAAERAGLLTRQLLAFARRQVLVPQVMSPADVVERIAPMLRRVIGEQVELVTMAGADAGSVRVDPGQLEQVIVNLAVNARDAMPAGGRLEISTARVEITSEEAAGLPEAKPGVYVALTVSDSGAGMDAETRSHIFEPFFTTKPEGKGTGLGLATVYGIVQQSGGFITVSSEPERGTTVRVHLPRVAATPGDEPAASAAAVPRGTETILLVEDDPAVRGYATRVLTQVGYSVLEAATGADALALAAGHPGLIDLVVTDIVMPGMQGVELVRRLSATRPTQRVLYMSGFADDAFGEVDLPSGVAFLPKPFTVEELAQAVRATLDRSGLGSAPATM